MPNLRTEWDARPSPTGPPSMRDVVYLLCKCPLASSACSANGSSPEKGASAAGIAPSTFRQLRKSPWTVSRHKSSQASSSSCASGSLDCFDSDGMKPCPEALNPTLFGLPISDPEVQNLLKPQTSQLPEASVCSWGSLRL